MTDPSTIMEQCRQKKWARIRELLNSEDIEFPKESESFDSLRFNIKDLLDYSLPHCPEAELRYVPETYNLGRGKKEIIPGYFFYKRTEYGHLPYSFGIGNSIGIVLTYQIFPHKGIIEECKRVIESVFKVYNYDFSKIPDPVDPCVYECEQKNITVEEI